MTSADDPVLHRRAVLAKWVKIGQRTGYLCMLTAFVVFVIGFSRGGFNPAMVAVIEVFMVIGSVLLIPTIVLSHGIRAAVKDEAAQKEQRDGQ